MKSKIKELQEKDFYIPPRLRRLYRKPPDDITASNRPIQHVRRWVRIFTLFTAVHHHDTKIRPPHTTDIRRYLPANQIPPPHNSNTNIISKRKSRYISTERKKRPRTDDSTLSISFYFSSRYKS